MDYEEVNTHISQSKPLYQGKYKFISIYFLLLKFS